MRKYTKSELKSYISSGFATDITDGKNKPDEMVKKVGYSIGTYGISGGLFQGIDSGKFYAITKRNTTLLRYF